MYQQLLTHESILAIPLEEVMLRILDLLTSMKLNAVTSFCEEKNNAIECLLNESSLDTGKCFVKLVWFHFFPYGKMPHDQKP